MTKLTKHALTELQRAADRLPSASGAFVSSDKVEYVSIKKSESEKSCVV